MQMRPQRNSNSGHRLGGKSKAMARSASVGLLAMVFLPGHALSQDKVSQPLEASTCEERRSDLRPISIDPGARLGASVRGSLTGTAGDPGRGLALFIDTKRSNCVACHEINELAKPGSGVAEEIAEVLRDAGDMGPPLDGVASRLEPGELRLVVIDPRLAYGDRRVVMPSYFSSNAHPRTPADCAGAPLLAASELEDVVAFLRTLTVKSPGVAQPSATPGSVAAPQPGQPGG